MIKMLSHLCTGDEVVTVLQLFVGTKEGIVEIHLNINLSKEFIKYGTGATAVVQASIRFLNIGL